MNKSRLVWVAVLVLAFVFFVVVYARQRRAPISGSWRWTSMRESLPAAQSVVPNPADYTLTFNDDRTFSAKVDCNLVSGTYEIVDTHMSITLGPTTLAECGPVSLYNIFLANLESVDGYRLEGDRLVLLFGGGKGEMFFSR